MLQCVDEVMEPLRDELKWGFDLPYMINGFYNLHPRSAIAYKAMPNKGCIRDYYESTLRDSSLTDPSSKSAPAASRQGSVI